MCLPPLPKTLRFSPRHLLVGLGFFGITKFARSLISLRDPHGDTGCVTCKASLLGQAWWIIILQLR